MPTSISLGERILQRLADSGKTRAELAQKVGKDVSTVSLWVRNRKMPLAEDKAVRPLAAFLEIPVEALQQELRQARSGINPLSDRAALRKVLQANPALMDAAVPLGPGVGLTALRARLREAGYDAPAAAISAYMAQDWVKQAGSDEERTWDRIHRVAVRTRRGKGVEMLATIQLDATDILEAFARNFRGESWPRAWIRESCMELNEAFLRNRERLHRDRVQEIAAGVVRQTLGAPVSAERTRAYNGLITALMSQLKRIRFIEDSPAGHEIWVRRWFLSEYVIHRWLGIDLLIGGLDFLFDGGLVPPVTGGISMLVNGQPGSGKSTLALQFAASLASQGHTSVYLTAEEEVPSIVSRLSFCGYALREDSSKPESVFFKDDRKLRVRQLASLESEPPKENGGCLIFGAIANRREFDQHMLRQIDLLLGAAHRSNDTYSCLILDSVDALADAQKQPPTRAFYESLFGITRRQNRFGLFVCEERDSVRDHLVDIVIRLGNRVRKDYRERVLEIEKCRTQHHIRGEHVFSIAPQVGIRVYPSIQAKLSVLRRRVRIPEPEGLIPWVVDEADLAFRAQMVRGSATLLQGPPATHKLPLGLTFLSAGLSSPDEYVLALSLREDQAAILSRVRAYPQLQAMLAAGGGHALNSRVTLMHFPPDYFTAERFLFWVERTLRNERVAGRRISRVLFNSLSQLSYNSPMFETEPLFIAALIELFRAERVSSLFLQNGAGKDSEIQNIFDSILSTERGDDGLFLAVKHASPSAHGANRWRMDRMVDGLGRHELHLRAVTAVPEAPAEAG